MQPYSKNEETESDENNAGVLSDLVGSDRVKTQQERSSALSGGAVTEHFALFWGLFVAASEE